MLSFCESVVGVMGVDYDWMWDELGMYDDDFGMYFLEVVDCVYDQCVELVFVFVECDFDVFELEVDVGFDDEVNMNLFVVDID